MLDCDVPIVAQIEGNCMGAGLEIACCCDIRIADASSKFGAPIARLGFPMAPREADLVMGQTGSLTVREMLLEAALFNAQQMHARGFLSRVVSDGAAAHEASGSASRIAAMGPQAARLNKKTLRALKRPELPEGGLNDVSKENILAHAYDYADSPEHREGIAAFLEKRKADF